MNAPFVLVSLGVMGLVNETNLDALDTQDIEVGKRSIDSFPAVVDLHGYKLPETKTPSTLILFFLIRIDA